MTKASALERAILTFKVAVSVNLSSGPPMKLRFENGNNRPKQIVQIYLPIFIRLLAFVSSPYPYHVKAGFHAG